jgi:hypothetical protein
MTYKDLEAELERDPILPVHLHLVSGKTVTIPAPGVAYLMQNGVLVLQNKRPGTVRLGGYDVISFRNFERIEQLEGTGRSA